MCRRVYGIEIVEEAVRDAERNSKDNGISNATFVAGKAEDQLAQLVERVTDGDKVVAVLDPPRAGIRKSLVFLLK